jgi:hypothetical protein
MSEQSKAELLERMKELAAKLADQQSKAELLEQIKELAEELADQKPEPLKFRVGKKGGVSVYGLGRFPVTLYYQQWIRLLEHADELKAFLEENKGKLRMRPKE